MEKFTQQEMKSLARWQHIREHKWRYILLVGTLQWGTLCGVITYLGRTLLSGKEFNFYLMLVDVFIFMIGGTLWVYWGYRQIDRQFIKKFGQELDVPA
jgi:hypothetical protein